MREEVRERGDKEAKGGLSKAGTRDSAGWKGRADTQSSCSVDNQTLYCLRYIRRNTVKNPVRKQGDSRFIEVVGTL